MEIKLKKRVIPQHNMVPLIISVHFFYKMLTWKKMILLLRYQTVKWVPLIIVFLIFSSPNDLFSYASNCESALKNAIECSAKEMAHFLLFSNIKSMAASHTSIFNFHRTWYTTFGSVDNPIVNSDSLLTTLGNRISNF